MKFKNFFIALSVLTISMSAMAMKRGFLLSAKEQKEKKELRTNKKQKEEVNKEKKKYHIIGSATDWKLVEQDLDCPLPGFDGGALLHVCVRKKNEERLIKYLEQGASINLKDNDGRTPLFYAISNQDISIAKILLEKGAKPNIEDCLGLTPLDIAEAHKWQELQEMLKKYGAKNGKTTDDDYKEIEISMATLEKVSELPQKALKEQWMELLKKAQNEKEDSNEDFMNFLIFCKKHSIPISKSGK